MAFIDSLLEFSHDQALTATAVSTNVVDLSSDRNVGRGEDLYVVVRVGVAADDANADETYVVDLQTDTVENFASPTNVMQVTIPRGSAVGTKFIMRVPNDTEQYLRLNYTLGGTTPSVTLDAWVTPFEVESWESLPDADNSF